MKLTVNDLLPEKGIDKSELTKKTYVGIDFGTSTSVVTVSHMDDQDEIRTEILWINQKESDGTPSSGEKIPTVIACKNDTILVGKGAAELKYDLVPGKDVFHSFKMELGTDLGANYSESLLNNGNEWDILNAKDATRVFLRYLKIQIDEYVTNKKWPKDIQYTVTIPASFEANQRKDLVECLNANQMQVSSQCLIDEPNAAFLSYLDEISKDGSSIKFDENDNKVLVFDFGAGTCDISIIDVGSDRKGIFFRNVSISRFEKLGGNDLDRLIVQDVLLPQLLEENDISEKAIRTKVWNRTIIPALMKPAEELKIQVCKGIEILSYNYELPEDIHKETKVDLDSPITIETNKRVFTLTRPSITYRQFTKLMKKITSSDMHRFDAKVKGQDEFISIFNPIQTALKKAELEDYDIDQVLLIGGSSKNPYIQAALKEFFPESEILIPSDTQTQVARGASIHSLFYNGLNKNIISPITSEAILILAKNNAVEVIVPAGAEIPTDLISCDKLYVDNEGQKVVEIPICIGSPNKMLFNLELIATNNGFQKDQPILLQMEISPDKLLHIRATSGMDQVIVEAINPFANKELTTRERAVLEAERVFNNKVADNKGITTKENYLELYRLLLVKDQWFKAAELLEEMVEIHPDSYWFNAIGLNYSRAGHADKAIEYYKKSYDADPQPYNAFNLGHSYKNKDDSKFELYLTKAIELKAEYPHAMFELGRFKYAKGKIDDGRALAEGAFKIWEMKYKADSLDQSDIGWFSSCAEFLGHEELAEEVWQITTQEENNELFNRDNLARSENSDNPF
jgi:molecular chaperone DnaK